MNGVQHLQCEYHSGMRPILLRFLLTSQVFSALKATFTYNNTYLLLSLQSDSEVTSDKKSNLARTEWVFVRSSKKIVALK